MIYFTTFIFTLLLTHTARAVPACSDVAPPEDMYDPTYDDEQLVLATQNATRDPNYDDPNGDTRTLACSYLYPRYPYLKDLPDFPYIGGSYNIRWPHLPNCGKCWKLTNTKTHKSTYLLAIDKTKPGFDFALSKLSFVGLSSRTVVPPTLEVDSEPVPAHFCGFKS